MRSSHPAGDGSAHHPTTPVVRATRLFGMQAQRFLYGHRTPVAVVLA
jgi:hypothetical protein